MVGYYKQHVFVCNNQKKEGKVCCANQGGLIYFDYLKEKLRAHDMVGHGKVRVSLSGCLGRCNLGPCIVIYPEGIWYTYKSFADLDQIIEGYFLNNTLIPHLLMVQESI